MSRYQVIVGNIGTVYDGSNGLKACKDYREYKRQSQSGVGRAGGENVVLIEDDEVKLETFGTIDVE